jgi:hypothetical protein
MSSKITYNVSIIDNSITNPLVENSTAKDNITPFSFLEFITITKIDYTPDEYNNFYISYLKEWSDIKNSSATTERTSFVDIYIQFLKEIVLTYTTNQEKRFLAKLNFSNPADLDIAIPFFVEKIRQIIIFYKDRRSEAQYIVERNKIRGNGLSIEKAIFEKIYEYVFAAQDSPSYASLGITLSSIQSDLKINIEEFADVYGNYFDAPPILRGNNQVVNLDTAALPLVDDLNYIVVDDFDTVSTLYNNNDLLLGNRDVFQTSTGLQTGTPVEGIVISNNAIIGVNSIPSIDLKNPATEQQPTNTLGYIPPGTTIPSGSISVPDITIAALNQNNALLTSNIADIQAAGLTTSLSGGIFTDLAGNIISDNTAIPVTTPGIVTRPSSNIPPSLISNDNVVDRLNNTNTNPVDPKLYFPDNAYSEIFGSTAFLEGLPLIANVDLKYDPICDPNNPIDIAKRDLEQKTGLDTNQVADLKRKLLSKYMGVDFYFIDTTGTVPVSGILLAAESPSSNIPNLQVASTPTVPGTQLSLANSLPSNTSLPGTNLADAQNINAANIQNPNINTAALLLDSVGGNQRLNIIDNRTNTDLTFGETDLVNNFGFNEVDSDRSGTYYAADVIGTPLETTVRDNSLNESIKLLRNVGLFFKPDKIGLFKLNAKNFTYTVDFNKLEPQKIYIFPDPSVYGNVSINSQVDYPVVFIYDYRPDVKGISTGFAQGDPLIFSDEQAFGPYYAREQSNEKQLISIDGLNLNFTDLSNRGYITKMQYDVFGNEYALFKDEFGQTFRDREELVNDRIVSKVLNGHAFYDTNEGYNFDYSVESVDGTTIRSGLSTTTSDVVTLTGDWLFSLSAYPMTFFFREFILYQELLNESRRLVPAFRDGGRFTFLDSAFLPDPLDGDDYDYPAVSNYYYELLVDAGISSYTDLRPPRPTNRFIDLEEPEEEPIQTEIDINLETDQTFADFTIDVRLFLSAGNVEDYDCGYFTDSIILQNAYNYDSNYDYYDVVSEDSKTILSQLSASHGYITQGDRDRLRGQLYVKNQAYSLSQPVSTALNAIIGKYSALVQNEVYNTTKDIDIVYDTLVVETPNYLIFDKIGYEDGVFVQPGTKNTVFKILSTSNLNRFSNRFFHEDKRSIVFTILSPFVYTDTILLGATDLRETPIITQGEEPILTELPAFYRPIFQENDRDIPIVIEAFNYDNTTLATTQSGDNFIAYSDTITLSSGNNKLVVPNIYEYNIKDNTFTKLFPLNTQLQDLSGLFSLESCFSYTNNFSIVEIKKPVLTYNTLNDMYKLSYIGVDNNNLFHLLDYSFFIKNDGSVEFSRGNYYKHDKIVRTSDLLSTNTTFVSAYKVAGDYIISNGKLIL